MKTRQFLPLVAMSCILLLNSCNNQDQAIRLELRKSFKNFLGSVKEMNIKGLEASVYLPEVSDYKTHVQEIIIQYLNDAQDKGQVTFDPQGIVLGRFLGLLYLSYNIKEYQISEDGMNATMRAVYQFSFDNNIAYNMKTVEYEPGTQILIPGKPWGSVITIVPGRDVPAPREQLQYIEIVVKFRKTNYEGLWQVRECKADEETMRFEISIRDRFDLDH